MPAKIINERPVCEDCKFWDRMTGSDTGACHAEPPRFSSAWPFTQHTDWCGKWESLPPQPEAKATEA